MKKSAQLSTFFSRVSYQEKILFTKHLATMYKAGIPITEALKTLIAQTKSETFRKILKAILYDVDNGQSLSKSLGRHKKVFDSFFISLIEVSEESGTLEENLEYLSKQLYKDYNLRKKIRAALIYPGIVLSMMLIVGTAISIFILPRLVEFFQSFDVVLPLSTRILLFISIVMKNYGILIFSSLIATFIAFRLSLKVAKIDYWWNVILIKLPIIGTLISDSNIALFSRNLGTLIRSGVPVVRSLEITADTLSNKKFRFDLGEIGKALDKGEDIATTLESRRYWEFPPVVSKMIGVGEKSGKVDEVLIYLGEFYEDEIDDLSQNLSTMLEPILLIVIGLAVGFVALSIISPIYQLTGSIGR